MSEQSFEMIAKTFQGLEETLAQELTSLGADEIQIGRRMVSFCGDKEMMYKANFCLRTAIRILKPIKHFVAKNADEVYEQIKAIHWEDYLDVDKTFAVDAVVFSEEFRHSKFVSYKVKDAIVDYFRDAYNKRPSVRISKPDVLLNIHIAETKCTLSLDSSGESLHRRGYRQEAVEAPLNEVLAAGMILMTGWHGECDLIDPMCGSGTIPIEAALIARNIAPGVFRKEFAFEKWIDFDQELFDRIYNDESQEREFNFKCYGADINPAAIEIAEKNIRSAGLMKYIELRTQPFQQCTEAPQPGIMVTNPPYGERISSRDLLGLYNMIGERVKHVFTGYKVWILSYKDECFDKIGLKPSEKMKLMNGSLECEYRCYDIFEGKIKDYKKALNEEGEARPSRPERPSFERKPDRSSRPNFRTDRMDRPARRFAAAHAEDDNERTPFIPGKRYFGDDRADGRSARRDFVGKRPVKRHFKDDEEFGGKKKFGDRSFKKPFKRRGKDDFED